MKITTADIVRWAPRVVGLGLAAFLSLFALDAFSDGRGLVSTIVAFAMGLVPALLVVAAVLVGWSRQTIGALIFAGLGIFYAVMAREHASWVVLISSPLLLVSALFLISRRVNSRVTSDRVG